MKKPINEITQKFPEARFLKIPLKNGLPLQSSKGMKPLINLNKTQVLKLSIISNFFSETGEIE